MYPPTTVCEVELNYLHIYVHSHHQKEHLIKNGKLFLFGRVCYMYSYLGECVQLIHPLVAIYELWLIKLKIIE
jgi:hypothetical protein